MYCYWVWILLTLSVANLSEGLSQKNFFSWEKMFGTASSTLTACFLGVSKDFNLEYIPFLYLALKSVSSSEASLIWNRCKFVFIKYVSELDNGSIKPPMNWWTWVTSYCKSTSNWKGHIGRGVKSHSIPILIKMPFWRYFQESAQTIARTPLEIAQIILGWISGLDDVCILLR